MGCYWGYDFPSLFIWIFHDFPFFQFWRYTFLVILEVVLVIILGTRMYTVWSSKIPSLGWCSAISSGAYCDLAASLGEVVGYICPCPLKLGPTDESKAETWNILKRVVNMTNPVGSVRLLETITVTLCTTWPFARWCTSSIAHFVMKDTYAHCQLPSPLIIDQQERMPAVDSGHSATLLEQAVDGVDQEHNTPWPKADMAISCSLSRSWISINKIPLKDSRESCLMLSLASQAASPNNSWLVVWNKVILGMSSSQLTNSYFSQG